MLVLFSGKVPKDAGFPDDNEDAFSLAVDVGRVAISDGASESFDSKSWANLLTNHFVKNPQMDFDWLSDAIDAYVTQINISQLSWSKQAAFSRGSFATLIGIEEFREHRSIEVFSVGDSLAVLLVDGELADSFPYKNFEEFQQRPELFCTNHSHNLFFTTSDFFTKHSKTWKIDCGDSVVLCMTDALGEWALRCAQDGHPVWQQLAGIRDVPELESLVTQERQTGGMRTDDATLVTLTFPVD